MAEKANDVTAIFHPDTGSPVLGSPRYRRAAWLSLSWRKPTKSALLGEPRTPMIPAPALEYLMRLGRRRGALDIDDIRQVLQVDTMSLDDLADAVSRLEDAGISVEIDPALLTRRRRERSPPEATLASLSVQDSEPTAKIRPWPSMPNPSIAMAKGEVTFSTRQAGKHAYGSTVVFVLVAALTLFILLIAVLGIWHLA